MQEFVIERSKFPAMQALLNGEPVTDTMLKQMTKDMENLWAWYERFGKAFKEKCRKEQTNVTHMVGIAAKIETPHFDGRQEPAPGALRTVNRNPPAQPPRPVLKQQNPPPKSQAPARRGERKGQKAQQKPKPTQANKKEDFWVVVRNRFGRLLSDDEIQRMFEPMNRVPEPGPPPEPLGRHWSERLREIASHSAGGRPKLMMPPGPPPAMDAVGDFWRDKSVGFQIEDVQRRNSSALHCLLNALVEIEEPVEREKKQRGVFLREHPLLPVIRSDKYAQYSFAQRLDMELESLGLKKQDAEQGYDSVPFQVEIQEDLKTLREETLKDLQALRHKILSNIQHYRRKERRMDEDYERCMAYLARDLH